VNPLRSLILAAAGNDTIRNLVATAPLSRNVVARFVAGGSATDAVIATRSLVRDGLNVTLDHLGEDTTDSGQAEDIVTAYLAVLAELAAAGLTEHAEVSVKLSAVGQKLDEELALANALRICAAAARVGTTVTLDMEDHTTTDSTLGILADLRVDFPSTGAVLQAYLRRTEQDCRDLSGVGSRVRLCKGAYREPETVAYQDKSDVDRSYVRCLKILMAGQGYPMVASHDPRLVAIAADLADAARRTPDTYEHQMLYGIRPEAQREIAAAGKTLRVYVPYGDQWYGYFMRRLAERPANVAFFLRSLATKS
jgi:proline dehydrogenase